MVYPELRKQGSGLARMDGWPQPLGSGREGAGDGLATLGLCVRDQGTLVPHRLLVSGVGVMSAHRHRELPSPGVPERTVTGMAPQKL